MKSYRLLLAVALAYAPSALIFAQTPAGNVNPTTKRPPADVAQGGAISHGIQVKDYTIRDGSDDTAGILSAIAAFETQTVTDVLDFGDATYVIATPTPTATHTSSSYMLAIGKLTDLRTRDVKIVGQGARLIFNTGAPYRTCFWMMGSFASLEVAGIHFEKDATPNNPTADEPNGRDLLLVGAYDTRTVESVRIHDCTFVNGFRAVTVYGLGTDLKNKLKVFEFTHCTVLNPYGTNVRVDGNVYPYGGGQQMLISPWAQSGIVTDNFADGGWEGPNDPAVNPSACNLDGFYFASPGQAIVARNICRRHAIEALFQTQSDTYLDGTNARTGGFTVPAVGSNVAVIMAGHTAGNYADYQTTWTPSARVYVQGAGAFEVVSYNPWTKTLTLKNLTGTPTAVIAAGKIVYENVVADSFVNFTANDVDMTKPLGGYSPSTSARGIVSSTRAVIADNRVTADIAVQLYSYSASPVCDDVRYSVISGNRLTVPDTAAAPFYHYGIYTEGNGHRISGNHITTPTNRNFGGIILLGTGCDVSENSVFVTTRTTANGYSSPHRGVGIGSYNVSGNVFSNNHTGGLDVGLGPLGPGGLDAATYLSHTDSTSALSVDNVNAPNYDQVLISTTGDQTLTNKTLTGAVLNAPRIASGGYIADADGNEALRFTTTSGAVNDLTLTNAITGVAPRLQASGADTHIGLQFHTKGLGDFDFYTNGINRLQIDSAGVVRVTNHLVLPIADYALYLNGTGGTNIDTSNATWRFNVGDAEIMEVHADGITSTKVTSQSDVVSTDAAKGIVLKSPNGRYWRFTVSDSGVLSPGTDLGTTPP